MNEEKTELDGAFIERQRERLEALQDHLATMEEDEVDEERPLRNKYEGEPRDPGDAAAHEAQYEKDEALHNEGLRRLGDVERALEKINEGSYGFSDISDEPIPRARLEAIPEAIYTVEEEERREG